MQKYFEELCTYLNKNRINGEYNYGNSVFVVTIHWGDWKHDHWRCDNLIEEFAKAHDIVLANKTCDIIDEDGSDCYSARHYYVFA